MPDGYGHGSHMAVAAVEAVAAVAAVAAGRGKYNSPQGRSGVAPGAAITDVRVVWP